MTEHEQQVAASNAFVLTPEQEASIDEGIRNAVDPDDEDVALSAEYNAHHDVLVLQLKTGQRLAIPCEDLQGLSDASPAQLAEVEIVGPGTALHWEQLCEGFPISALRQGIYGSPRWMANLAQHRREQLRPAGLMTSTPHAPAARPQP